MLVLQLTPQTQPEMTIPILMLVLLSLLMSPSLLPGVNGSPPAGIVATTTTTTTKDSTTATRVPVDIVAIVPDRESLYRNMFHNALHRTAKRENLTLEVREYGNYDESRYEKILKDAIDAETQEKNGDGNVGVYCVWPVNGNYNHLLRELHDRRAEKRDDVGIIKMFQFPSDETEWEYLAGYAGQDETKRYRLSAEMMVKAMDERNVTHPRVFVVGFPEWYGSYRPTLDGFTKTVKELNPNVEVVHAVGPDFSVQGSYIATLDFLDTWKASLRRNEEIHGVYCMADKSLVGVYQALVDDGRISTTTTTTASTVADGERNSINNHNDITLVGSVCDGVRGLLTTGRQYSSIIQSPTLGGKAAVVSAARYIRDGTLADQKILFAPSQIVTGETWETQYMEFQGDVFTADELCTWSRSKYERAAGLTSVDDVSDICRYVTCKFIPTGLFVLGYAMVSVNYALAGTAFVLLLAFRKRKVIMMAQPVLLGILVVGTVVDVTSIIFLSRDNRSYTDAQLDASCVAWPWLLFIGHAITTSTLVAKVYRVKQVCMADGNERSMRRVTVKLRGSLLFILGFVLLDIVVLTAWVLVDPMRWVVEVSATDSAGYIMEAYGNCAVQLKYTWLFPFSLILLHLSLLVYANFLAYRTHRFSKISDSKRVAIALFNSFELLLVAGSMTVLGDDNVEATYVIIVVFVFLNDFVVLLLVVWPKIYLCLVGKGDELPDLRRMCRHNHERSSLESDLFDSVDQDYRSSFWPRSRRRSPPRSWQRSSPKFVVARPAKVSNESEGKNRSAPSEERKRNDGTGDELNMIQSNVIEETSSSGALSIHNNGSEDDSKHFLE